jgi:hypothetical protein
MRLLIIRTLTSIAFISVLTFLYLAAFLITANIITLIIAQSWCFFVDLILQPRDFSESILAGQAFFTFGVLIILLFSGFKDLNENDKKITYSQFYLRQFSKVEDAISWWLIFRFYLGLLSGLFYMVFSIKGLINLSSIDASLLITPEPDIYIGKYFGEAKTLLTNNWATTLGLSLISYMFVRFAGKLCMGCKAAHKDLPFLQAILLVSVAAFMIVINWLGYLQITMSVFINSFLLTSILACVICIISTYSGIGANVACQKKDLKIEKKQYLKSFLIFLTSSNLLHWSVLFNFSLEHENLKISNWFHVLLVCFWCYLGFRFLWLSLNYEYKDQKEHFVAVPIAPVLVYYIYLSPVFKVFFLSWNLCFDLKKNSFYSFFTALLNPTIGLKPTLNSAETGLVVTIASPSETKGWLDFFGTFMPILTPALNLANKQLHKQELELHKQELAEAQLTLEKLIVPTKKIIALGQTDQRDQEIQELLSKAVKPLLTLQSPALSNEQKSTLITESVTHFAGATSLIQDQCPFCPVSPTTGITRPAQFSECLSSYAAQKAAEKAEVTTSVATSLAASAVDALEKVAP